MTPEDKIHDYANRRNLTAEDTAYMVAVLRNAVADMQERCAKVAESHGNLLERHRIAAAIRAIK